MSGRGGWLVPIHFVMTLQLIILAISWHKLQEKQNIIVVKYDDDNEGKRNNFPIRSGGLSVLIFFLSLLT
jgi:hypothetical protein